MYGKYSVSRRNNGGIRNRMMETYVKKVENDPPSNKWKEFRNIELFHQFQGLICVQKVYADGHDDDDNDSLKLHREFGENRWMEWVYECVYCVYVNDKPFSEIYTNLLEKEIATGHNGNELLNSQCLTPYTFVPKYKWFEQKLGTNIMLITFTGISTFFVLSISVPFGHFSFYFPLIIQIIVLRCPGLLNPLL